MCRSFNDGKQLIHCCHCCASKGLTCSSQPAFRLHKSCKISLPPRITGDTKHNGSKRLDNADNMLLRVNGRCGRSTINVKASSFNFHNIPRSLSSTESFKECSEMEVARSDSGMYFKTVSLFVIHFRRRKPRLARSSHNSYWARFSF